MNVVLALAVLVVSVSAKPQPMSLEQRIDDRFMEWIRTEKREVFYPDGFKDKVCNASNCCQSNSCAHGTCRDTIKGPDDIVSLYGYACEGRKCGVGPGQYAGAFCDVKADTACNKCRSKHNKVYLCYPDAYSRFGYLCLMKQKDGNFMALDRKELDVLYGEGSAAQLERIAKEESEAEVGKKDSLVELLRELLADFE